MPPASKPTDLYQQGPDWFCNAALASDIVVIVDDVKFHLHKFPLISRCGRIANLLQESQDTHDGIFTTVLQNFPGGPDNFLSAVRFCYGFRVELTPRNIVMLYGAADYLEMTDAYGEDNLLSRCESFFHKSILQSWKECIVALQSCELMKPIAEKLQLISKCLNAVTMMVCTDPSLFGWPMLLYGSLQSPGGSILWNGINTGARIRSMESGWWFEDISYLSVDLFERLIKTMQTKGIRSENIAGSVMYYARTHLPGLGRWHGGPGGKSKSVASFSLMPATVDQKGLIERIEKLLPEKKGKSFCRFMLGLLRNALILGVDRACREYLERRIGMQLDLATVDGLLIPMYSDSDTLYDTDCMERIVHHFVNTKPKIELFSPSSLDLEAQSVDPLWKVSKLLDCYLAEVASDAGLKPDKMRSLIEALPDSSRTLHDGLVLSAAFERTLRRLENAALAEERGDLGFGPLQADFYYLNRALKALRYVGDAAWARMVKPIRYEEVAAEPGGLAEKLAAETLWLAQMLTACGYREEAVSQWASASSLAWLSLRVEPRLQGSLVKVSAFLFKQVRQIGRDGEALDEDQKIKQKQTKMKMLVSWLPLLCRASNGVDAPVLSTSERAELVRILEDMIDTLNHIEDQEKVLSLWLHHFTYCPSSDWPNLRECYARWCSESRKRLLLQ